MNIYSLSFSSSLDEDFMTDTAALNFETQRWDAIESE
jgi:hypothetical protein